MSENFENVAETVAETSKTIDENVAETSENVAETVGETVAETSETVAENVVSFQNFASETSSPELPCFIKDLTQFAFYGKGDKKIPVYPYVVALTGHREANLTDEVKDMATKQLRALSKAWDAKSGRKAPLIALVGVSGKSEWFWIDTAIKLRDQEKRNIKVVAVTSMPYKYLNLVSQHDYNALYDRLSKSKEEDKKGKVDAVIECPIDGDFLDKFLVSFKNEFKDLTGQEVTPKENNKIFNWMLSKNSVFRYLQIDKYVKFMSLHSHSLIALADSNDKWKTANWLSFDIERLQPNSSAIFPKSCGQSQLCETKKSPSAKLPNDSDIHSISTSPKTPQKDDSNKNDNFDTLQWFWGLKDKFLKFMGLTTTPDKPSTSQTQNEDDKRPKYIPKEDALQIIQQKIIREINFTRTDYMILYKLLGRIGSRNLMFRLNEKCDGFEDKNADITFASIGPVVCIAPPQKDDKKKKPVVSILVKDRPFDEDPKVVHLEKNWSGWFGGFKSIAEFPEIKQVLDKLGMINRTLVNQTATNWEAPKSIKFFENEKELLLENDKKQLKNLKLYYQDDNDSMDSLVQHYYGADKLAKQYEKKTNWRTWGYCFLCFIALCLCYPCEKMHDWIAQSDSQVYEQFTVTNTFLLDRIPILKNWCSKIEQKESKKSEANKQADAKQSKSVKQAKTADQNVLAKLDATSKFVFHVSAWIIVVTIFVISGIYWWSWWRKYHLYYHYFTMIAEGLKIQIFWRLAGMRDALPGQFRYHQTRDFAWLRTAFIGLDVTLNDEPKHKTFIQLENNFQWVKHIWLGNQLLEYSNKHDNSVKNVCFISNVFGRFVIWILLVIGMSYCFRNEFLNLFSKTNLSFNISDWGTFPIWSKCHIGVQYIVGKILSFWNTFPIIGKWLLLFVTGAFFYRFFRINKLYKKLNLSEIEYRHNQQLLFPYHRAYILLGRNLELWKIIGENLSDEDENQKDKRLEQLSKENQEILRQIGQIVLGKKSDWHLLINDRNLTLPR